MKNPHGSIQLPAHVDVLLGGEVALVSHEGLEGIRGQLVGVHSRKGASKIMEAVSVAKTRV